MVNSWSIGCHRSTLSETETEYFLDWVKSATVAAQWDTALKCVVAVWRRCWHVCAVWSPIQWDLLEDSSSSSFCTCTQTNKHKLKRAWLIHSPREVMRFDVIVPWMSKHSLASFTVYDSVVAFLFVRRGSVLCCYSMLSHKSFCGIIKTMGLLVAQ